MSEKLGRVMWAYEKSVKAYDIGERPAFYVFDDAEKAKPRLGGICSVDGGFQQVYVFTPEELRDLLEEAFKAGRCDNDGGNVQIDYNDGHGFKYPRFANFLAQRGLGGKGYEVPQELR